MEALSRLKSVLQFRKKEFMKKIVVVPPASPGNFGDLATVVAARKLFSRREVVFLDLFSGLDKGIPNWSHYSDIATVTPQELSSVEARSLVFIAQDTLDGRYGEFHLEKLRQSIEILDSNLSAGVLPIAVWNITAEESNELGPEAKWLLSRASQIIARDASGYNWTSSSGFEAGVAPDLASVGISEALLVQIGPSTSEPTDVLSVGWQAIEHFEELGKFLENDVHPSILEMFILDERIYRHQPGDLEVSLRLFAQLDTNSWVNIHSLGLHEKTSTISHLSNMVASISRGKSFTTSRYHGAMARLLSGKPVNVVAHNSKFSGLDFFGLKNNRKSSGVIMQIAPKGRSKLPNFRKHWKTKTNEFLAIR
jgi:hypothetical protein